MVSIIYTTIDNLKDARKIAYTLVDEQMVACVNIIPEVESIYKWKGKIEESSEYVLIAKTVDENVGKTINRIKSLHSYELPDIVVLPIKGGLEEYLGYIDKETS